MNPRTTKDGILSPAPLARLDYPRVGEFMGRLVFHSLEPLGLNHLAMPISVP